MNMDNTEVSFFSSECALFEYAIKDNDNFLEKCLILAWWGSHIRMHTDTKDVFIALFMAFL